MSEELTKVEQSFDTLSDAVTYVFRQEQTSLLSLDRICQVLQNPGLFINIKKQGLVPCSTVTRRRISSTLSSCELFVRAGPPRVCLWAIRPNNPLFLSDGVISSSIEQMLTTNGPMTLEQFVAQTQLNGADITLFERFLSEHGSEFARNEDGTYWFTGQPSPIRQDFESISDALVCAFQLFPTGASVEELAWCLCIATVGGSKNITRRCVSRELSRRTDLFIHLSRARYISIENHQKAAATGIELPIPRARTPEPMHHPEPKLDLTLPQIRLPMPIGLPLETPQPQPPRCFPVFDLSAESDPIEPPHEDEVFDPFNFFTNDFQFAFE